MKHDGALRKFSGCGSSRLPNKGNIKHISRIKSGLIGVSVDLAFIALFSDYIV